MTESGASAASSRSSQSTKCNFCRHRYEYLTSWLRFSQTLSLRLRECSVLEVRHNALLNAFTNVFFINYRTFGFYKRGVTRLENIFFPLWEKNGDLHIFDVSESKYGKQHALPPTTVKGERFNTKKYFLSKKRLINFKIDMYSSKRVYCIYVQRPT